MELRQLEYFKSVCENKNFTHAAEKLHVSQPTITNSINKLEEELGVRLLKRNTKTVSLTGEGEIFYKRVTEILSRLHEAVSEVKNANQGVVQIGLPPMIGTYLFPHIFLKFHETYKNIEFRVLERGSYDIQKKLVDGELELGFMILPESSETIHTIPFVKEQLVVCLPPNHPLAHEKELDLKNLENENFILLANEYVHHRVVIDECKKHGFVPRIIFKSNKVETVKALVSEGVGITLMMKMAVEHEKNIKSIPLKTPVEFNIGLAWKKGRYLSGVCLNVIKFFQDYFDENENQ